MSNPSTCDTLRMVKRGEGEATQWSDSMLEKLLAATMCATNIVACQVGCSGASLSLSLPLLRALSPSQAGHSFASTPGSHNIHGALPLGVEDATLCSRFCVMTVLPSCSFQKARAFCSGPITSLVFRIHSIDKPRGLCRTREDSEGLIKWGSPDGTEGKWPMAIRERFSAHLARPVGD